ncbi:MAG: hypothetical protein IJ677_09010 [Alphaproteobacteria bacterium]|nr:hypothetical protein [Alphaproteobacteria bacterium]
MKKSKSKYSMKEKLDIAESVVTILMFVMAVWGSIVTFEEGFWGKLNHIVNHYHHEFDIQETALKKDIKQERAAFHR